MKKYLLILLLAVCVASCNKDESEEGNGNITNPDPEPNPIELSTESVDFPIEPTQPIEVTVSVSTGQEWYYTILYVWSGTYYPTSQQREWLSAEKSGNKIIVTANNHEYKPLARRGRVRIHTFGEPEHIRDIYISQTAYYLTIEGINHILSLAENIFIDNFNDETGNGLFHYSGEDHPFELNIDLILETNGTYMSGGISHPQIWWKITGDNKTNLKLEGKIYIADYYDNHILTYKAGHFEITVNGADFNKTFSYSPNFII